YLLGSRPGGLTSSYSPRHQLAEQVAGLPDGRRPHAGPVEAIAANLPGTAWQRCTHYAANLGRA
ncbi:MAG: hypothetical protein ACJ72Y_09525, partial [Actinomycetes bacterium]